VVCGVASEADGGDDIAGCPAIDQGAVGPGEAGKEAPQIVLVLLSSEEGQVQELRFWLWSDVRDFIN
jgi:hypothetical protein